MQNYFHGNTRSWSAFCTMCWPIPRWGRSNREYCGHQRQHNQAAAPNSAQWLSALQGCLAYTGEMPPALNKCPWWRSKNPYFYSISAFGYKSFILHDKPESCQKAFLLQAVVVFRESTRLSAELRAEVTAISHGTHKTRENGWQTSYGYSDLGTWQTFSQKWTSTPVTSRTTDAICYQW